MKTKHRWVRKRIDAGPNRGTHVQYLYTNGQYIGYVAGPTDYFLGEKYHTNGFGWFVSFSGTGTDLWRLFFPRRCEAKRHLEVMASRYAEGSAVRQRLRRRVRREWRVAHSSSEKTRCAASSDGTE